MKLRRRSDPPQPSPPAADAPILRQIGPTENTWTESGLFSHENGLVMLKGRQVGAGMAIVVVSLSRAIVEEQFDTFSIGIRDANDRDTIVVVDTQQFLEALALLGMPIKADGSA